MTFQEVGKDAQAQLYLQIEMESMENSHDRLIHVMQFCLKKRMNCLVEFVEDHRQDILCKDASQVSTPR